MYVPAAFSETRPEILAETMSRSGLATLVTLGPDGLIASHVPMLLDPDRGPHGTLLGHIARANPQWQAPVRGVDGLAIFTGAEAYITPSWYRAKQEHGRVVPTWNYVAVHAYGPVTFFEDAERLHDVVRRLTDRHEAGRAAPWAVSDAPAGYIGGMLRGIVGFAMPIARLEGKWKMSQNRDAADRDGVARGLAAEQRNDVARLIPLD
ncbi:MAG: FMN-binding negative transcriptional regulator [Alphaproteobacteria bacterium]|nr:FMN-binding negative transcriptional regulator [Alphaproteobacteria bacterium]